MKRLRTDRDIQWNETAANLEKDDDGQSDNQTQYIWFIYGRRYYG